MHWATPQHCSTFIDMWPRKCPVFVGTLYMYMYIYSPIMFGPTIANRLDMPLDWGSSKWASCPQSRMRTDNNYQIKTLKRLTSPPSRPPLDIVRGCMDPSLESPPPSTISVVHRVCLPCSDLQVLLKSKCLGPRWAAWKAFCVSRPFVWTALPPTSLEKITQRGIN